MASSSSSLRLRLKPQTLTPLHHLRRLSSDSSSSPPPLSFDDIKSRLRNPSTSPKPPPEAPTLSSLYTSHTPSRPTLDLDTIRRSLKDLGSRSTPPLSGLSSSFRSPNASAFSLRNLKEKIAIKPGDRSERGPLPRSIFGKEMDRKPAKGEEAPKSSLVRSYGYEELGEKLRMFREKKKKSGGGSFSLHEMKERLVRLREHEEKKSEEMIGGVAYFTIRDSLEKLKDGQSDLKETKPRLSILNHISGFGTPEYELMPPKEHLVEKYFHPDLMSSEEKMKLELKKVREEFKMSESDCGSARVQVAQLTTKIKHLSSILHKKDKHSQKGLQAMVQRRRKLLKYMRRTDWDSYCFVLSRLGLRDVPEYRA